MERAEKRMEQGFQMLGANCWQPHRLHAIVFFPRRSKVSPAVRGDLMSHASQALSNLFVISLNPAVFRHYPSPPDKCDPEQPLRTHHCWKADQLPRDRGKSGTTQRNETVPVDSQEPGWCPWRDRNRLKLSRT